MTSFKARRWDGFPVLFAGLLTVGLFLVSLANRPMSPGEIVILVCLETIGLATAYLMGPVAYVRSHAGSLLVGNELMRHLIPLRSIQRIGGYENLGVDVELDDGRKVPVRAFEPSISPLSRTPRGYMAKGRTLEQALEDLSPVQQSGSGVSRYARRVRVDSVVAIAVIVAAMIIAFKSIPTA